MKRVLLGSVLLAAVGLLVVGQPMTSGPFGPLADALAAEPRRLAEAADLGCRACATPGAIAGRSASAFAFVSSSSLAGSESAIPRSSGRRHSTTVWRAWCHLNTPTIR